MKSAKHLLVTRRLPTLPGCGGGSLIHFWQKWRETRGQSADFKETVTELAQMLL